MRVLLSTYDSRGGGEPLLGLAVRLREFGAEVRMGAPPDCAERLAEVGVPPVPVGPPVHSLVHGPTRASDMDVPRLAAESIAAQSDTLAAAAEGCHALVASGLVPAAAGVAGTIRTDGARVAATLLLDAVSRRRQPMSA